MSGVFSCFQKRMMAMGPLGFIQSDTAAWPPPASFHALRTDSIFLRAPEYRIPLGPRGTLRKPYGVIFLCRGPIYINVAAISHGAEVYP